MNPDVDLSSSALAYGIQGFDFFSGIAAPFAYANYRDWYVATQPANVHVYLDYAYFEGGFSVPSAEVINSSAASIGVASVDIRYTLTSAYFAIQEEVEPGEGLWLNLRHPYSYPTMPSSYLAPSFDNATVTMQLVVQYVPLQVQFVVEGR